MPNELRPYQFRVYHEICNTTDDLLCQLPTGAGKTLILSAAVASLLQRRTITHALIACPQLHIAEGFLDDSSREVQCGTEAITLGPKIIRPLRDNAKLSQIISYLKQPNSGHAVTLTHQSLSHLQAKDLPESLVGCLLVIDEAHHAALETNLGLFQATWRTRGGRIVSATATDFRADGQTVRLEGMRVIRRSLAEHMQDRDPPGPYAPKAVESEIVGVEMPDPPSTQEVEGYAIPHEEHQRRMVAKIIEQWESTGRPKTIVKVPVLEGGSGELVNLLVQAFAARNARVYDATGTGSGRQEEFIGFLDEQRDLTEYADAYDVVVGVQRVIEGTDWPWCSDVFVVGVPRSLVQTIQLLGRATRLKHWKSYDPRFRDRAKITFFVSTREGSAVDGLDMRHSNKVLALLAFMADTETGLQWVLFDQIRFGLTKGLAARRQRAGGTADQSSDEAVVERVMDRLADGIDQEYEGIARLVLLSVRQETAGRTLQYGEALQLLQQHELIRGIADEDARAELLPRMVLMAMESADPSGRVRRRVRERVEELVASGDGDLGQSNLAQVWQEVVAEFRDETMPVSADEERFAGFLHTLTGGTIAKFAERLNERYKTTFGAPISLEDVHAELWDFYQREGDWPSAFSGEIERFGISYKHLNQYLLVGTRGLPGRSSVYRECEKVAAAKGVSIRAFSRDDSPLTVEMVRDAIRQFNEEHKRFPVKAEVGMSPLGFTWQTLNFYLRTGYRGLPGGSTLTKEVEEVRKELGLAFPKPTRPLVLAAIREYREKTGKFPVRTTKGVVPGLGIVWGSLNGQLLRGVLGEELTLGQLVEEVRASDGFIPGARKDSLSVDAVREAIREFFRTHGVRPNRTTKLPNSLGMAWSTLQNALKRGDRGLPGGSSLAAEVDAALAAE